MTLAGRAFRRIGTFNDRIGTFNDRIGMFNEVCHRAVSVSLQVALMTMAVAKL